MLAQTLLPDGTPCPLHYTVWGDQNSPKKLFAVHGLTRNGLDFEVLATALVTQGYCVIAPDMPGRGKSPKLINPAFYNNAVNGSLCLQLLAQLGVTNISWLGTSMGGMIALIIANQAPTLINKLILNDVGCMIPAGALQRIAAYVGADNHYVSYADAEQQLKERTAAFAIPARYWESFAKNSIIQTPQAYALAYDTAIFDGFSVLDLTKDLELWPLWEAVKPVPTLLIRGEQSDLLLEPTAITMQATHPRLTRYNVAGAGHAPALMSDEEIQHVNDFLIN